MGANTGTWIDPLPQIPGPDQTLKQICANLGGVGSTPGAGKDITYPSPGFGITGDYDEQDFTYIAAGAANNDLIATQIFKKNGASVGTLAYTYVGSTNNIASIKRTS